MARYDDELMILCSPMQKKKKKFFFFSWVVKSPIRNEMSNHSQHVSSNYKQNPGKKYDKQSTVLILQCLSLI